MTEIVHCLQHTTATEVCIVQGAATTIYAATAPELAGKSGAYLADCAVTTPTKQARDPDLATALWDVTEKQLQEATASLQS